MFGRMLIAPSNLPGYTVSEIIVSLSSGHYLGKMVCILRSILLYTCSVKCQLSDYVFLGRVPRRTIIAKTSNLHQKVGYRQDYKYRKLHVYTPKTLTVVLSLVQTRKNQLSATGTYYRKSIHRIVSILGSTS